MHAQRCPNCREKNDVSVYVHGQLARCVRCGLRFTVERGAHESLSADARPMSSPAPSEHPTDISFLRGGTSELVPTLGPGLPEPLTPEPVEEPDKATLDQRPATPRDKPPENLQGQAVPEIPGYECIELLGRGGMGEVWKARQKSLERVVAIKILSPTLAVEPDFVRRFERESSALAALAHPHVVSVYDRGSANGHWYFVMEFVEGRSLRDRSAEGRLTRAELLRLTAQTARAVDYAHSRGVIHRDLKPENILVDHAGNAKVADFGLAGMSEHGRSSLTMTAVAMGTAHYMAPEQRRDAKNVDGRADLYSLGVMLYELITNELPVGRFATPREKVPDTDPKLDEMVLKLLEQDPAKRPERASQVADLLESLAVHPTRPEEPLEQELSTPPHLALRDPMPRSAESFVRSVISNPRRRWLVLGAVAVLAIVVAVSVFNTPPVPPSKAWLAADVVRDSAKGATITFGAGDLKGVRAIGTGWSVEEGVLERDAATAQVGERPTRAYIETVYLDYKDAAVEADIVVEEPTGALANQPPFAELVLYGDQGNHLGVRMTFAEDSGFSFFSSPEGKSQKVPGPVAAPKAGQTHHLVLFLSQGLATASVDGQQVARVSMTRLEKQPLRAALGCVGHCRFTNVKVRSPLPPKEPAPATAGKP